MEDEKQKRTYEFELLGLPPLRMVLVHAENERANRIRRPLPMHHVRSKAEQDRRELIIRLIETLEKE